MIVVVDGKSSIGKDYYLQFAKEGFASGEFSYAELDEWIGYVSDRDIAAVEAFVFCSDNKFPEAVEKIQKRSHAPVLALIKHNDLQKTLALLKSGADDVLATSVDIKEIIARVAAISRRNKGGVRSPEAVLEFGGIQVFNDGRDPKINGEEFILPRRERRILEVLMANKDRRVSKTQLFNAVYGLFETEVEENVIESHISKLRKRFKQKFNYDIIDSKRFLGYRLKITD